MESPSGMDVHNKAHIDHLVAVVEEIAGLELGEVDSTSGSDHVQKAEKLKGTVETLPSPAPDDSWLCAICRCKIPLEETSQVKGCEHAYCITCILRWATYKEHPWCPQCRLPFSFLYSYRTLNGSLSDVMVEESICLLLRATWFSQLPLPDEHEESEEHAYVQFDDDDEYEEEYFGPSVRLGNRRWGDNGYVRGGRMEARPVHAGPNSGSSSARALGKGKGPAPEPLGRRAKRSSKRESADCGSGGSTKPKSLQRGQGHRKDTRLA
eukprot:SM000146S00980  [mRNA]  locus=s146:206830:208337:- [translate_table: standard]